MSGVVAPQLPDKSQLQQQQQPSTTITIRPNSIKGCDDVGNYYDSQAELMVAQERHRDAWYAANDEYWRHDAGGGYGGNNDDEAMVGDEGSEADAAESLAFLDRLILAHQTRPKGGRPLGFARAIDAGAGVGRITKHVLLKRYDSVRLVEADSGWSKRSRAYMGRKRSERCDFTCSRLEDLTDDIMDGWGVGADLIWLQWTLQYLTDKDAVETLKTLARGLIKDTGIFVVKENRPFGVARLDRFQMDTPDGPPGNQRYDITRTDAHHRLLFQQAGLVVNLSEEGVETNTYSLSRM